jgi:hypothetical protein
MTQRDGVKMTFTESNTVADANPLNLQDARAGYGVAGAGVGWTCCRRRRRRASRKTSSPSPWSAMP